MDQNGLHTQIAVAQKDTPLSANESPAPTFDLTKNILLERSTP